MKNVKFNENSLINMLEAPEQPSQKRRQLLTSILGGTLLTGLGLFGPMMSSAAAAEKKNGKKGYKRAEKRTLIVFYSYSGNTKKVAEQLKSLTNADIVELELETPYSTTESELREQLKKETADNILPTLKTTVPNLNQYNVILLGSPIWGGTIARPVMSFLKNNNLSGKVIAPFATYGSKGLGNAVAAIQELAPNSKITEPLGIQRDAIMTAQANEVEWLNKIRPQKNLKVK